MRQWIIASLVVGGAAFAFEVAPNIDGSASAAAPKASSALARAIADPRRKLENRARDRYRHPAETLAFFGVQPTMTVVEITPGGGWYTEILAPLLRDRGHYIATVPAGRYREIFDKLAASDPSRFDKATVTVFDPATTAVAPPGSADVVLTFRNIHNFLMAGDAQTAAAFAAFYKALKPGGVLGVVDHRLPEDRDSTLEKKSGYIKRSTIVRYASAAGFRLASESRVNANPKDTADWSGGVWTLPPTLALKEQDRDRYLAIGESDRLTLKFVKPL